MIGFKGKEQRAEGKGQRAKRREQRAKGRELEVFFSLERGALMYNTPTLHVSAEWILRAKRTGYITPRLSDAQSGGIGYLQSGIGSVVFHIIFCISLTKRYKK